jgi:hypothetical protein
LDPTIIGPRDDVEEPMIASPKMDNVLAQAPKEVERVDAMTAPECILSLLLPTIGPWIEIVFLPVIGPAMDRHESPSIPPFTFR